MKTIISCVCCLIACVCYSITLTCAWNASPDPQASGYNVYWGASPRTYTNKVNAGNNLMVTISNLPNVKLYFAATAYDPAGLESDFSVEAVYTPSTTTNILKTPAPIRIEHK